MDGTVRDLRYPTKAALGESLGCPSASGWKKSMWVMFVTLLEVEVGRKSCRVHISCIWACCLFHLGRAANSPHCWGDGH